MASVNPINYGTPRRESDTQVTLEIDGRSVTVSRFGSGWAVGH